MYNYNNNNPSNQGGYPYGSGGYSTNNKILNYKGLLVDTNWVTPELYVLENSDELIQRSGARQYVHNRPISNLALTATTRRILYKLDSENMINQETQQLVLVDPYDGLNWGMRFRIVSDPSTRTKNVYVDHYTEEGISSYNRNIMSIMKLLDSKDESNFGLCFSSMVTETNLPTKQVASLYIKTIYSVCSYIEQVFMSENFIRRNRDGRYVMSANMYDLLTSGRISVGGILIKPTIFADEYNNLAFDIMMDFSEDISVSFKGDFDYMSIVK